MRHLISLVVDDEPAVRNFIAAILETEGFRCIEAAGGERAWLLLQSLGGEVDLMVSDVEMPNGDGLSLAHAVRAAYPKVPIVLVSGYVEGDCPFEAVGKPFRPSALMDAVQRVLTQKPSATAA